MAELRVDTELIGQNTEVVAALLRSHCLNLVAVTKGCVGDSRVAAAMLAAGASGLADSRDANLRMLRAALPQAELHRISLPTPGSEFEAGDITYVSSQAGALAVANLAAELGGGGRALSHRGRLMLYVETGDQREGVPPNGALALAEQITADQRLELVGIATNYACFLGPADRIRQSVEALAKCAAHLRSRGLGLERVSGGNSSLLSLLRRGETLPGIITELRCGEALLLGHDALVYEPLPGCRQDACVIRAEVVEEYTRPAAEHGVRRLVVAIGRQDLGAGHVVFSTPGLREIGRSADYLVIEAERGASVPAGGSVEMIPGYEALVAAWTSPYVNRVIR